jgi:uncharacterized protein
MLIERCRSVHTFGMRTPILACWLDPSYRVLSVQRLQPGRLAWNLRARHVLECNVDADIKVGDAIERSLPG